MRSHKRCIAEANMKGNGSGLLEYMCAALEIKEKMKALYAEASEKCSDHVGSETFRMLLKLEETHLDRLRTIHADLEKGNGDFNSCRFYDFESPGKSDVIKKIAKERRAGAKVCLDDLEIIERGMALENSSIEFWEDRLRQALGTIEREFLNYMIAEERGHYIMLADLKFYYLDPEHWFMEKSRAGLDGAGVAT